MELKDRLLRAQANLEATVRDEGYDWTVRVSVEDGYKVVLEKGTRKAIRASVDEGTLEDTVSVARALLVRNAASVLEGQP